MKDRTLFENTETAFVLKSDSELERAYFLFKMISSQPLVKIGTAATNFALKANLPVEGLIRSTVFDHFCGGVNEEDCLHVIDNLYAKGVSSVLDYSVEGKETEFQSNAAISETLLPAARASKNSVVHKRRCLEIFLANIEASPKVRGPSAKNTVASNVC